MRANEPPVTPWIILDSKSIKSSHCTCMAGLGEVCSHVGSVLFLLEYSSRNEKTVTDVRAYWTLPSKGKKPHSFNNLKMDDISLQTAKKIFENDVKGECEVKWPGSPAKKVHSHDELGLFLNDLQKVHDQGVIFRVVKPFCDDIAKLNRRFPLCLAGTLYDENYSNVMNVEEIVKCGRNMNFALTAEQISIIQQNDQRSNEWFLYRTGRITASLVREVCFVRNFNSNISLLKRICYPEQTRFTSSAVEYGHKNEEPAKEAYKRIRSQEHIMFEITDSGLWIHCDLPFLGASPDGIISCSCCGKGILEVKCPVSISSNDKQISDLPYLSVLDGIRKLNSNTSYYFQIQCQIMCVNVTYADLFIWSPTECYIERIYKDERTCKLIANKSEQFFYNAIIPELICKFYTRANDCSSKSKTKKSKK